MKRIWIAIFLLIAVISGCALSEQYLCRITAQLSGEVYRADVLAQADRLSDCAKLVYSSYQEWKAHENAIGAIIRHQEMDDIESLYLRALQNANNRDKNEYLVQSKELQGLLLHLADMEKPKIKNLF